MEQVTAKRIVPEVSAGGARIAPRLAGAAVLLAATLMILWAWGRGLSGPYLFDDYVTPLNDPASQSLAAWREYLPVTLRPVTKLSYALEAEAGLAGDPAGRRVVSIALLLASGVLLGLLAARLTPLPDRPTPTAVVASFIALLWLAHPVHADNVLLISGRSALLSGMFLLGALLALEHSRSWLAGALFLLACLARETALAGLLPLAVLAASRPGTAWQARVRQLFPSLLAAAIALAWILSTPRYLALAEYSFLGRPFRASVVAQVGAVPAGLSLLFKPGALSIDYGLPLPRRISDPFFMLGLGMYAVAVAGIFFMLMRSRALALGLSLWLAAILPTQSIMPKVDALTNRPLTLALAGLLLSTAPLWRVASRRTRDVQRAPRRQRISSAWPTPALAAATLGALVLLINLTDAAAGRAALFRTELGLWQDAAEKSRSNARPLLQYAKLLIRQGETGKARLVLAAAQRIDPFDPRVSRLARAYPLIEESQ